MRSSASTTVAASPGADFDPPQSDAVKGSVGGKYIIVASRGENDLGPYAAAMQEVAAAPGNEDVPFIDLFTSSGTFMQTIGNDECITLLQPGDVTHWNRKGTTVMAAPVARGVAEQFPIPTAPVPTTELSQYLRRDVLGKHSADIDQGLTVPRPIIALENQGGQLWLDWFLQPSGVTLQKTSDLTGTWTAWDIGAGAATGGDGSPRFSRMKREAPHSSASGAPRTPSVREILTSAA